MKLHNTHTAEVHVIGVREEWHSKGIGSKLLAVAISYLKQKKYQYLTVKTLDGSAVYAPYNKTRQFYLAKGFVPLEVFTNYWDEENPCLFMIKAL